VRKDLEGYTLYFPGSPLYFTNFIGNEILKSCNGKKTVEEIIENLSKKYGINYKIVEKDVNQFLKSIDNFLYYES